MKILIFEYITGGGFNKQDLPEALAHEGRLMLQALLDNLHTYVHQGHDIAVTVMLDARVNGSINTGGFDTVIIKPEQNSLEEFMYWAEHCDAAWPIAPEFDGILQTLCLAVESLGKQLLTSSSAAVAITGNKLLTYQHLKRHHIATVPTQLFTRIASGDEDNVPHAEQAFDPGDNVEQWLVKPIDGVGCADSFILTDRHDFEQMHLRTGRYIIQPHIFGQKTSLSCLFKAGSGWLLCANLQHFKIINRQYHLSKIIVNHHADAGAYQELIDAIATALPELWGYVGIDLIETPEQLLVLEINPRLTTSFTGINAALGINVAAAVLQLLQGPPVLNAVCNQAVTINVQQHESD